MPIKKLIDDAVAEYHSDPSIYSITNLFFEEGAEDAAQSIYDATKDLVANEAPENLISYVKFFVQNGVDINLDSEVRRIFSAIQSNVTPLCELATLVTPSGYPEEAKCRPDIPALREEIIAAAIAAVSDFYDANQIVELVAGKYQGLHLNDVAAAEKFIEDCKGKMTAAEIKKLQKTLKDVS
jgi:hypothetical protein